MPYSEQWSFLTQANCDIWAGKNNGIKIITDAVAFVMLQRFLNIVLVCRTMPTPCCDTSKPQPRGFVNDVQIIDQHKIKISRDADAEHSQNKMNFDKSWRWYR